jgi:ABC-2 type transport system ATP-binding protein
VKFSELERFIDQKLKNYSSGMQVRLAFSVSIHANRDILLMDEVLAVGDLNFQSKCLEEFNKYQDMGRTVIIVTHDIAVVERYCDRVMLLRNGKIVKIGKAEEVASEYIQENISDEESRLSKSNKKDTIASEYNVVLTKSNKFKKIAEIIKVEFLDKNGNVKNVFETGVMMTVRIYFKTNRDIHKLLVGIAIFDELGSVVYGTNNLKRKKEILFMKKGQEGIVDFVFKEIHLINGKHKLNIAIAKNNGGIMDQCVDRYHFYVNKGLLGDYGIVNLNPEVTINLN